MRQKNLFNLNKKIIFKYLISLHMNIIQIFK